eukprot:352860-Chlamydomonas_euryale.AAC.3
MSRTTDGASRLKQWRIRPYVRGKVRVKDSQGCELTRTEGVDSLKLCLRLSEEASIDHPENHGDCPGCHAGRLGHVVFLGKRTQRTFGQG